MFDYFKKMISGSTKVNEIKKPGNDLMTITSVEKTGEMVIIHGVCKKKVRPKDIKPLTKVMEDMYHQDVYLTVDPSDNHKIKLVITK